MFLAPSDGQVGGIEKLKIHFDICMQVKVIATSIYLLGKLTNTTTEVVICLTKLEPFYHFMGWIPDLVWRQGN